MEDNRTLVRRDEHDGRRLAAALPTFDSLSVEDRETLIAFLGRQLENERTLNRQLAEFGRMLMTLNEQNQRLQKLVEARVTVTTAQARALSRAVAARAMAICDDNHLDYSRCGRRLREAMVREVKACFSVAALGDLPSVAREAATRFIGQWSSYALQRELRTKCSETAYRPRGGAQHV